MRAISRRLGRLEGRLGLVETEETRRARVLLETLRRRRAAQLAREGHPQPDADESRAGLSGLTVEEVLLRGRQRAPQANATKAAQAN